MLKYKSGRTGPHIKTRSLSLLEEQRLRELVERQSHSMPCGRWCKCPQGCYEPPNVRSLYCACGLLAILSLSVLLGIWFGAASWYYYSDQFLPTLCTPINSSSSELDLGFYLCPCLLVSGNKSTECQSASPCQQVWVTYEISPGQHVETLLHETLEDIRYNWQCSYLPRPCNPDRFENARQVSDFQSKWSKPLERFPCYHHPHHMRDVVRVRDEAVRKGEEERRKRRTLHGLLWPAVCSVMFLIGMVIPAFICGCRYIWSSRLPSGVMDEQQQEQSYPLEGGAEHIDISSRV